MSNVAAQVALQRGKKEKRGGAELGRVEPAPRKDEDQGQNRSPPSSLSRPSPPAKGTRHPIKDAWALVCSSEHWGLNQVNPHRRPVALSTWWVGVRVGRTADMAKGTTGTQWPRPPVRCAPHLTQLWAPPPCRRAGTQEADTGKCTPISVIRSHTHTRNPRTGNPTDTYGNNSDGFLKRLPEGPELRANSSDPRTKASESPFLTSGRSLDSWRKSPQQLLASRPQV